MCQWRPIKFFSVICFREEIVQRERDSTCKSPVDGLHLPSETFPKFIFFGGMIAELDSQSLKGTASAVP